MFNYYKTSWKVLKLHPDPFLPCPLKRKTHTHKYIYIYRYLDTYIYNIYIYTLYLKALHLWRGAQAQHGAEELGDGSWLCQGPQLTPQLLAGSG